MSWELIDPGTYQPGCKIVHPKYACQWITTDFRSQHVLISVCSITSAISWLIYFPVHPVILSKYSFMRIGINREVHVQYDKYQGDREPIQMMNCETYNTCPFHGLILHKWSSIFVSFWGEILEATRSGCWKKKSNSCLYVRWKLTCAMVKSRYIGDGHTTFNKNPYNGYINPYYWVEFPIPYYMEIMGV